MITHTLSHETREALANLKAYLSAENEAVQYEFSYLADLVTQTPSVILGGIQAGGGVMTYRASKAAVIQFTKSAAIELAHYEIRVNAIAPGSIPTPILASSARGMDEEESERFEAAVRETMRADRPLKREGTPDDIAEAALYFASERSRYVTGTVLPVDGGTVAGKVIRSSKREG